MMKKYAVAAAFAGSLLAAPAFAQDATSCEAMLTDFDAHLAANNVEASDERVTAARTEAEEACMAGDMTAAEESLDNAVAELGIPPRSGTGDAAGGDTGTTESQNQQTGTTGTGTTGGTDTSGGASGSTTTTGSGSTTGTSTDTSGQSGSTSTTQ